MRESGILLLCILFIGCSGCTGSPPGTPVLQQPVFSNGSVVADSSWISMNPIGDHKKSETFTITGSTDLPVKSIIEVIIVQSSNASAADIRTLDDCIREKQRCVLYFGRVTAGTTGVNRWSVTTDDSNDLLLKESATRYTAIVGNAQGTISARSEFGLT